MSKQYRYYREWMASHGWGVMLDYDTVMAKSTREANTKDKPFNMYSYYKTFECVVRVRDEHLQLTDNELSKIYGEQE